jgi:predicted DNA-binding protein YlxM (UPF0122 family)
MSGHKNYTTTPEVFQGVLPKADANKVSDYYRDGLSVAEVLGVLRIGGKKVFPSVIKEAYKHVKTIEDTVVRILNGTSIIYNPTYEVQIVEGEEVQVQTNADTIPNIPTSVTALKAIFESIVAIDKDKYQNVYDVSNLEDLKTQINHIIDNVITVNGSLAALKAAVTIQE